MFIPVNIITDAPSKITNGLCVRRNVHDIHCVSITILSHLLSSQGARHGGPDHNADISTIRKKSEHDYDYRSLDKNQHVK